MEVVKSSSQHNAAARCTWQYRDSKPYLDPIIKSVPGKRFESYSNIYAIYSFMNAHLLGLYCRRKLTHIVTSNAFNTLFSFQELQCTSTLRSLKTCGEVNVRWTSELVFAVRCPYLSRCLTSRNGSC